MLDEFGDIALAQQIGGREFNKGTSNVMGDFNSIIAFPPAPKLDRLGRNAMDVRATIEALAADGVRVQCLALGNMDLTSAAGKMTMGVINAVAEIQRHGGPVVIVAIG